MADFNPNAELQIQPHFSDLKTDPIRNFKFLVNIPHKVVMRGGKPLTIGFNLGFMSVDGFSVTNSAIPYRSGGMNTTPQMLPGQTSFTPISFTRGLFNGSTQNFRWFLELFSVNVGRGVFANNGGNGFRSDVLVYVMPHPRTDKSKFKPVCGYKIFNAWPTAMAVSALNAGDNSFLVENMTLTHEGWEFFG